MQNNLCPHCSGRGFHWHKELLLSRADMRTVLADIYSQGETCDICHGSGQRKNYGGVALMVLLALLASAFVIMPIINSWLNNVGS